MKLDAKTAADVEKSKQADFAKAQEDRRMAYRLNWCERQGIVCREILTRLACPATKPHEVAEDVVRTMTILLGRTAVETEFPLDLAIQGLTKVFNDHKASIEKAAEIEDSAEKVAVVETPGLSAQANETMV